MMSIYKELNDIQLDLQQYEEMKLTSEEQRKWRDRVVKKLRKQTPMYKRGYRAGIASIVLATALIIGTVSVANMPFVAAPIEEFTGIHKQENVDFSAIKTDIGVSAENEYGKLTLNEVLIDGGRLLLSSTFEPAEGVDFHYRMHPLPTVLLNGQDLVSGTAGQTIEINNSMFTVYNSVRMKDIPLGENLHLQIEYDHLDLEMPVENPWIFDIVVPTEQIAAVTKTIHFDQEVSLGNGLAIQLEKMIITPVSTVLYYDWPEGVNHISFKIVSESGQEILPYSSTIDPQGSHNRFKPIDLDAETYFLVPYEASENRNAVHACKVPDMKIPINAVFEK